MQTYLLVWTPPEADLEARIKEQEVCLGGDGSTRNGNEEMK